MRGVNRVHLIGNCGRDPELRTTRNGTPVTTLSVATSEQWVKDGEKQESTTWHRVVAWGKLAEVCHKYLEKGRQVYIEGRIQTREWKTDKGEKRSTTEIVANQMVMLGPKNQSDAPLEEQLFGGREPPPDDEVPF